MILCLIILFVVLMLVEHGYIALATRCGIGVTHSVRGREIFTPVGGGWVVLLAAVASVFVIPDFGSSYLWLVAGGVLLGVVSFVDDIMKLSASIRLVIQTVVVAAVLFGLAVGGHALLYVLGIIFVVGYLNSSNFMDGTDGILAIYSMIVLLTLWAVTQTPWVPVVSPEGLPGVADVEGLSACLLAAALVMVIYNARDRARVFAGDIGSISLGYFIAMATLVLGIAYGRPSILVVVLVFLVDTFVTFVERVLASEDVMSGHQRHLYQRLIAAGCRPVAVASWYALAQGAISAVWLVLPPFVQNIYACTAAVVVTVGYVYIKKCVNRNISCR